MAADGDSELDMAFTAIYAAQDKAVEIDVPMDIAVVDDGGNLKAFTRMDGAFVGSIDIAIMKAKTSAIFPFATGELGELSQPGQPLYKIELSNDGLITFPGGVPLMTSGGEPFGGIGVSTGTVEQDHEVAIAGVEALAE
ncbi:MAG: heme-binding protein [Chloroflexota bacterium]